MTTAILLCIRVSHKVVTSCRTFTDDSRLSLSTADLKALFARFQTDATTMYPKVQGRIATLAHGTNLASIMKSVTG